MALKVQYDGQTAPTNTPSRKIWANCPVMDLIQDPCAGRYLFDDFYGVGSDATGGLTLSSGMWDVYADTGVTMSPHCSGGTTIDSALEIAGNDADNDEGHIASSPIAVFSSTNPRKMWFEARFKKASIANNDLCFFLGLGANWAGPASIAAANSLVDATGVCLATGSFFGFHCDAADGDAINAQYEASAQTPVEHIAGVHVPVADTYVKLGFVYDPDADSSKRITWYVDGTAQTTYVTQTQIDTATFPQNEPMQVCLLTKACDAAESKCQLDWIRFAQLEV